VELRLSQNVTDQRWSLCGVSIQTSCVPSGLTQFDSATIVVEIFLGEVLRQSVRQRPACPFLLPPFARNVN
jgi:hypothetical protein